MKAVDDVLEDYVTTNLNASSLAPNMFEASSSSWTAVTGTCLPTLPNIGTAVSNKAAERTIGDVSNSPISLTEELKSHSKLLKVF